MKDLANSQPKLTVMIRGKARILSVVSICVVLLFMIGEGFNPARIKPTEWILFLFFPFGISLGMILAWWREGIGCKQVKGIMRSIFLVSSVTVLSISFYGATVIREPAAEAKDRGSRSKLTSMSAQGITVTPPINALNVDQATAITVSFQSAIDVSTIADSTLKVIASMSGYHSCTFNYSSATNTITIMPKVSFKPGDVVTVIITNKIKYASGTALLGGFLWNFTIRVRQGSGHFTLKATPSVGGNPWAVTVADFNGDGTLDLASICDNSDVLTVLLNSGRGSFTKKTSSLGAYDARGIAAADFNGDGIPDIAVSNYIRNNVAVFANDGNGNFTYLSLGHSELEPHEMAISDFNADGAMDIASADYASGYVTILQNDGHGHIAPTWVTTSGGSYSIVSGDFNGDGYMDLALATDNAASILPNNGLDNPQESQVFVVGKSPYAIVAADFNGDGTLDLATANFLSNDVSILLNDGKAVFKVTSTLTGLSGPDAAAVGDFNGDGTIDLAVANSGSNSISIFLNDGKGTFTLDTTLVLVTKGNFAANCIKSGDFDGNGSIDLVVVGYNSDTLALLLNESDSPIAPTGLVATSTNDTVHLRWNRNAEDNIRCYRVFCDTVTAANLCVDSVVATDTIATITGLKNQQSYFFRIAAVDSAQRQSDFSNEVRAFPRIGTYVEPRSDASHLVYELLQNSPNPFNPTTVINYQIATAGQVELKVFDLLGREVRTLINESQNAGIHSVIFDGNNLPSGVYFYRLQAGTYSNTKKLLLLK